MARSQKWRVALEALGALLWARVERRVATRVATRITRKRPTDADPEPPIGDLAPVRICRIVQRVDELLPGGGNCLVQALAADRVLRMHGYRPTLRIGVLRVGAFEAHSWLECDETVVIGGDRLEHFVVLKDSRAGS